MTLHLTPAEGERIAAAGSGVLFREGDYLNCQIHERHPNLNCRPGPPVEFVGAAAACETCDGTGFHPHHRMEWHDVSCDCIDGKRRVAAVVPCECYEPQPHCPDGFVTVGHVIVTWGPLVVVDRIGNVTTNEAVVLGANSVWHVKQLGDDSDERRLSLPPDVDPRTLVGQYAIGVEVVS